MLPYILGGAAALALLGSTAVRRKKHHSSGDARTATTRRIKIVDSRHAKTLRMTRANPRVSKTHIEFIVQGNYGYGWDDENTELNVKDARRSLREYRENGSGSYRLIRRRVKNDATNPRSAWGPGEHTMHIDVPGGILAAYWFDDGRWLLRYNGTIVARGTHFRPAPSHRSSDKKSGLSLIAMATAALPGSGSGIAGDEDSLKAWTKEGIRLLDRSAVHDEISILESDDESRDNPKRRRKGKKAKWSSPGTAASRLAWWRWHHNPAGAPDALSDAYRKVRMAHSNSDRAQALKKMFRFWSKADHAKAAAQHKEASTRWHRVWNKAVERAHRETFGKAPRTFLDYKVSGIGRDEYPERYKRILRKAAQSASAHGIVSDAHAYAAKHLRIKANPKKRRK